MNKKKVNYNGFLVMMTHTKLTVRKQNENQL